MSVNYIGNEDLTQYIPTLAEQLTANFYLWERRGRGWEVFDSPVELEPPFEPFFHGEAFPRRIFDDARKPSLIGSWLERLWRGLIGEGETKKESMPVPLESRYELLASEFSTSSPLSEFRVSLPKAQKINVEIVEQFLLNLRYCSLPISFEIIGSQEFITVQFTCWEPDRIQLRQQLQAYFPDSVIADETDSLQSLWHNLNETAVIDFGLSQEFMRPLRTLKSFEPDPMIGIFGTLESLEEHELGIFQALFQPAREPWSESILRSVTDNQGHSFFADAPEMLQLAREKVQRPFFATVIRVAGQSSKSSRAWEIAKSLASGLSQFGSPQSNELIPLNNDDYDDYDHARDVLLRQSRRIGMLFNSQELAALAHPPSTSVRAGKLLRELKKTKALPTAATGHQVILGENVHQGKSVKATLNVEQRLRHMHVIGATGTGKSTLLLNLIRQDIENGFGLAVLDPHGDLIERILELVPDRRFDDVILFDPSDADYPVGFNILSARSDIEKNVLASDLTSLFQRFSTSWGDQMTSVLGNAILAFLESPHGGTLVDLRRFLVERGFREDYLHSVADPEVVYYWQKEFPLLKGNPQASILTRLNTFLRTKLIRNIVSQKTGLNFDEILSGRKIFLAKLAQGLIGEENAYLLGALLVSKIHQVIMARQAKASTERETFFLYIDEFHNFITPSLASILSGARKYHLGLILAHQELRQLWNRDTELANSVISNPGTRVCFRLGDFDAQKLESGFSYFDSHDLQNLSTGEAIVRIERVEHDFNLKAAPPPETLAESAKYGQEELIRRSREKYGAAQTEVETQLTRDELEISEPTYQSAAEPSIPTSLEKKPVPPRDDPRVGPKLKVPRKESTRDSQHRYLQTLIKKMAEEKGFRATLEQPTPDGQGRVDVSLEREGLRIACEISLTTTEEQELHNIEKCLAAGYNQVVVCSPDRKTLDKIRTLTSRKLPQEQQERVFFHQPEDLFLLLEAETAVRETKEERVKGYRVKVQYQPLEEPDKKIKREAVAQVIVKAMRRMKGNE